LIKAIEQQMRAGILARVFKPECRNLALQADGGLFAAAGKSFVIGDKLPSFSVTPVTGSKGISEIVTLPARLARVTPDLRGRF
jgi:hypothetical protein